jgi:hypothetical protein
MKGPSQILADLVATTPGEEGKWFATAKELKLYDLALKLAKLPTIGGQGGLPLGTPMVY